MPEDKAISCHLKLTPKADERLLNFQERMLKGGLKMSKADLVTYILENISIKELERISAEDIMQKRKREKIEKIFKNSNLTKNDLDLLFKPKKEVE